MGWSVYVKDVVCYRATCNEFDCNWMGPNKDIRAHAEYDAELHARDHADRWEAQNKEWEKNHG